MPLSMPVPLWAVLALALLLCGSLLVLVWLHYRYRKDSVRLRLALVMMQSESKDWQRRHGEVFSTIEGILGERDDWQARYSAQAAAHAGAQDLLFSELSRVSQIARKAGLRLKLRPDLKAVMQAFRDAYCDPEATAILGDEAPGLAPGPQPPSEQPGETKVGTGSDGGD
jgi:hypothetical protein